MHLENHITVAVCTYNRQHLLGPALRSLIELTPPPEHSYDIVIVDDASPDDTAAVVARESVASAVQVRYVRHEGISG